MKLKCSECNREIKAYKKVLHNYGVCLNCLPTKHRCTAVLATGSKCHYPKVNGSQYCTIHISRLTNKRKEKSSGGYVYIMDLGFDNLYKIGKTTRPQKRLASLRAGNPRITMLLCQSVTDNSFVEAECHEQLKRFWVEREIFKLSPQSVNAAKKIISLYQT